MAQAINLKPFRDFFRSEQIGGIILLFCVTISLIIANSSPGKGFEDLLETSIGFSYADLQLEYPVSLWINDGLMAVFFLLVGLEIKREIIEGELSSTQKAAMPIFAALGGMLFPQVFIFYSIQILLQFMAGVFQWLLTLPLPWALYPFWESVYHHL